MIRARFVQVVVAAVLATAACGGADGASTPDDDAEAAQPVDRAGVVAALVVSTTPQRFDALASDADDLVERAANWCADLRSSGDAADSLKSLRDAAVTVRNGWASLAPFGFGPAMQRRSRLLVDFPISSDGVAETLAGDQPVDAGSQRELGAADERGLGVVFELAADEVDPASDIPRRCAYLVGAAELAAEEIRGLAAEWSTFGTERVVDDESVDDTLQDLVSEAAFSLAMVDPESETAETSGARVRGVSEVFFPSSDLAGVGALLDEGTAGRLRSALDAATARPTPDLALAVEVIVRTDVVAELSLSLNFSDADGDG